MHVYKASFSLTESTQASFVQKSSGFDEEWLYEARDHRDLFG